MKKAVLYVRCQHCERMFKPLYSDMVYCSGGCKAKAKNAQKEEAVMPHGF